MNIQLCLEPCLMHINNINFDVAHTPESQGNALYNKKNAYKINLKYKKNMHACS